MDVPLDPPQQAALTAAETDGYLVMAEQTLAWDAACRLSDGLRAEQAPAGAVSPRG